MATVNEPIYRPGLEGVIAGETAISTMEDGLRYRGYPVEELADRASFEEVAYLVLRGERPAADALEAFRGRLWDAQQVAPPVMERLHPLADGVPLMDAMRSAASLLGHVVPQRFGRMDDVAAAEYLIGALPVIMCGLHRMRRGAEPLAPRRELPLAANILYMVRGEEPDAESAHAMNASLILYVEHGFNASTFACRVVGSTLSDLYSGITAAVGALKGPLHGGANERVLEVLEQAGGPEQAPNWIRQQLERKTRVMGFGHRVYKSGDPRAAYLKRVCRRFAERIGDPSLEETAEIIERELVEQKGLHPNVDWPAGRLYHYLGLDIELYTPLFVCSRVVGWSAHFIEQQANNRILRPSSRYVGPELRHWDG